MALAIFFSDVAAARDRLAPYIVPTPLLENTTLNDRVGRRILIKPEVLQRTGSFKIRGALNRLLQLSDPEKHRGVVAFSSGNHAQGVAEAARLLDIEATVVMPCDAPAIKLANTRRSGAQVVLYHRQTGKREEIAADLAARRGAVLVPSFDDPAIIAGQGTVGLEIADQAAALGLNPTCVVVPVSGGGLISGIAVAMAKKCPKASILSAEPEGFDDTARSLCSGRQQVNRALGGSICDALLAPSPGELTFPIMRRYVSGGLVVSDDEVLAAMAFAWRELKLVVEPGGAVGLGAILAGRLPPGEGPVVVVLSGGNASPEMFAHAIEGGFEH